MRNGLVVIGRLVFRNFLDVDIERVQKQPAVRRIWAAIHRPVIEQRMEGVEPHPVGAQRPCEFDQLLKVGEIADAPIARRADAVELHRQQPAAVEIAAECARRRHDERHLLACRGCVRQSQPIIADRQIGGPEDGATIGLAFRDPPGIHFWAGIEPPAHRQFGRFCQFAARRLAGADHDHAVDKPVRRPGRKGIDDDLQGGFGRDMADALPVDKFG